MKGVYTVKRKHGTSVCVSYTPVPGEPGVRERLYFVRAGADFTKRLAAAERDAAKKVESRRAEITDGRFKPAPKRGQAITFTRYVEEHYVPALRRSAMKSKPRDVEIRRCTRGTLGRSALAKLPLVEITRSAVEKFIDARLAEGAGAPAVNRDLSRLCHLLNDVADREELGLTLPRIAWRRLTMKETPQSYRPARDGELRGISGHLHDRVVRDLVEFLIHTGLRPEAGFRLRWEHVDFERGIVNVTPELDKIGRGYVVYMNSVVEPLLRALHAWRPQRLRTLETPVFARSNGKARVTLRTAWRTACKAAGVEGLCVRGLRATAATRLAERGATEIDVKLHLGHATSSFGGATGRYLDPNAEHRRAVAELTVRKDDTRKVIELRVVGQSEDGVLAVRAPPEGLPQGCC